MTSSCPPIVLPDDVILKVFQASSRAVLDCAATMPKALGLLRLVCRGAATSSSDAFDEWCSCGESPRLLRTNLYNLRRACMAHYNMNVRYPFMISITHTGDVTCQEALRLVASFDRMGRALDGTQCRRMRKSKNSIPALLRVESAEHLSFLIKCGYTRYDHKIRVVLMKFTDRTKDICRVTATASFGPIYCDYQVANHKVSNPSLHLRDYVAHKEACIVEYRLELLNGDVLCATLLFPRVADMETVISPSTGISHVAARFALSSLWMKAGFGLKVSTSRPQSE